MAAAGFSYAVHSSVTPWRLANRSHLRPPGYPIQLQPACKKDDTSSVCFSVQAKPRTLAQRHIALTVGSCPRSRRTGSSPWDEAAAGRDRESRL
jgi:hypothetical protein